MDTARIRQEIDALIPLSTTYAGLRDTQDMLRAAADHIDRLTTELAQLRADHVAMMDKAAADVVRLKEQLAKVNHVDVCSIPESAFPDYPARDDCQ